MSSVATTSQKRTLFSKDGTTLHDGQPLNWLALSRQEGVVVKIVVGQLAKEEDSVIQLSDPFPVDLTELFPSLTHLHLWNIDGLKRLPALPTGLKCLDLRGCRGLLSLTALPSGNTIGDCELPPRLFALRIEQIGHEFAEPALDTLVLEQCPALVLEASVDRTRLRTWRSSV